MQPTTRDQREGQARDLLRALRNRSKSQHYMWDGDMSVEAGLLLEGSRFEFVQAMRLLTRIAQRLSAKSTSGADASHSITNNVTEAPPLPAVQNAPEAALIGEEHDASARLPSIDQPLHRFMIRLRARVGMDFSASSVHAIVLSPEAEGYLEVIANVMALGGQNAPLPEPYAEMLLERQRIHDMAMTDFLDIFHHRLLELYYQTTLHMAPWLEYKHPAANGLAQMLFSLAGLGPLDVRNRMSLPDRAWLRYTGLLWHRPRSAVGFERIVTDHFHLPAQIMHAVGRWFPIEPEDQSRLGRETCRLGKTATLGNRVWIREAGLLLRIGPIPAAQFADFLPNGKSYRQLMEMAKFYFEDSVTLDLELERFGADAKQARLGKTRLAWTSWTLPKDGAAALRLYLPYGHTSPQDMKAASAAA